MMDDRYQHLQPADQEPNINSSTKIERRRHTRHKINKNLLSISEDVMAEVVDISGSGISFQFPAIAGKRLKKIDKILLLDCQFGTSVEDLTCRLVRSSNTINAQTLPATMIMNCGLEFYLLSRIKYKQLIQFIKKCNNQKGAEFCG
jgi:c-di-GMP-binding flagellar brake protein YcgR